MLINVHKDGLHIRIFPLTQRLLQLLSSELTYTTKRFLATYAERKAANSHIEFCDIECYLLITVQKKKQLVTLSGYLPRLKAAMRKAGYQLRVVNKRPHKKPQIFEPNWNNLKGIRLRPKQREFLERIVETLQTSGRGQICWPTGAGKSFLIQLLCMLLPKPRICVTTKHLDPLLDMYNGLRRRLPDVGVYSSRKRDRGHRVMCYSAGSLHKADEMLPDIIIADEVHEMATAHILDKLGKFRFVKMLAFSANYLDRFDSADFELEGCFGPLIANLSYQEAVDLGLIVPLEVEFLNVVMRQNPCEGLEGVFRKRHGIWRNVVRNKLIAKVANRYPDDQVLITVKTVEHAIHIKRWLPDFTLCYDSMDINAKQRYAKNNLLPDNFRDMTPQRREQIKKQFEEGKLKKVIATSVWNRGVNFHRLQVLIRADAGSSSIDATQIPGRLSRLCEQTGKTHGILIDFLDNFDETCHAQALVRKGDYKAKGWKIKLPG